MTQFKNEFADETAINQKFDARLEVLELSRIDAMIAEASPTSQAVVGMGVPPVTIDPATGQPGPQVDAPEQQSVVERIEQEILDVRKLRADALKSAAKTEATS
jgi:hypothetical protein